MSYYKLSNEITDVVISALHHFDHIGKNGVPQSFEEATASVSGGIKRYQCDPVFRAKVQALVSHITKTVQDNTRAELTAANERVMELEDFNLACVKQLYEMLGIDGSDGEFRFKWAALELSNKLKQLAAEREVSDKLLAALRWYSTATVVSIHPLRPGHCDDGGYAASALTEVAAIRKGEKQ